MNERLMHATIALAARCDDHDAPMTCLAADEIARKLAQMYGLGVSDCDALCRAAAVFAAPLDEALPSTALPASGAPTKRFDVIVRNPDEPAVMSRAASLTSPPHTGRTMVGVGGLQAAVVVGNEGTQQRDVKARTTIPEGTPPPGTASPGPPQRASTVHAQPPARAGGDLSAPSGFNQSAWDTFDGASTGVHAT